MSESNESQVPLVIDLGSSITRIGFAGEEFPDIIVPTEIVQTTNFRFKNKIIPALDNLIDCFNSNQFYFGEEINRVRDVLNPEHFLITNNWTALERFLEYLFGQLKIKPEQTPMIFILPFKAGDEFSERVKHLMFDHFNVPKIFFPPGVLCALHALETDSGVVVSLGDRHTAIVSIFKGFGSEIGPLEMDITGERITEHLGTMITKLRVNVPLSLRELQCIKEKVALFVRDPVDALKTVESGSPKFQHEVGLLNGESIILEKERFMMVEPYFQPNLLNSNALPLPELIAEAIKHWGLNQRPELGTKIYLTGGGTLVPNFLERLEFEMKRFFPNMDVKINAPAGRENLEWIGASRLFKKGAIEDKWIINKDWEKHLQESTESEKLEGGADQ